MSTRLDNAPRSAVEAASNALPASPRPTAWWPVWVALLVLSALRLIHLTADTPSWISPTSAGEYVDEGYKTLSPRNLTLFGRTHWHPEDDYTGWMKTSPVTNWSYYLAFQLGDSDLPTARLVTVTYFALFLAGFVLAFRQRYPRLLVFVGIVLLSLQPTLFFFSRIAIFEVPIIFFLYGWLFLLTRFRDASMWWPLAATLAISPLLGFGLKLSALAYLAPVIVALVARAVILRGIPRSPLVWVVLALGVVGLGITMVQTHWLWGGRLEPHPVRYLKNLLSGPLPLIAPFLFLAGWLAALHLAVTRPRELLASAYRCALLSLALLGPLIFGLFPYDPPRYFVPLLPAYVLVVCEWFALNGRRVPAPLRGPIATPVAIIGLTLWLFVCARVANHFVLAQLPLDAGAEPGIGQRGLMLTALPLALALAAWLGLRRARWLAGPAVQAVLVLALLLLLGHAGARLGDFYTEPRFRGDAVRAAVVAAVPPQSSIAGDWAPFFTLGTDLRPLYMNRRFNQPERIAELRPDYFLHSETEDSEMSLTALRSRADVQLGEPILREEYNHRAVLLIPLRYPTLPSSTATAPAATPESNPLTPRGSLARAEPVTAPSNSVLP